MSEEDLHEDESLDELAFFDANPESDPMGIGRKAAQRAQSHQKRGWFMLAVFVSFFSFLTWMLSGELVYFFSSDGAHELGRAEDMDSAPENNTLISISGIARDMCIRAEVFSQKFRFMYLLGSKMGSRILVQTKVRDDGQCQGAEEGTFVGRVVDLNRSDRYEAVVRYYREHFPSAPKSGPMYMLEDGVLPGQAWYYPTALGLMLLLVGVNLWFLLRTRKRNSSIV